MRLDHKFGWSVTTLPVTVADAVALHPREAWPVRAGDDVDFDADPSVSGVTVGTGTALGSARSVATFGARVARGVFVTRLRRLSHYGITGITARVTSENCQFFFFLLVFYRFSFRGKFRVSGPPHAERTGTGPEFYATAQRVVRAGDARA